MHHHHLIVGDDGSRVAAAAIDWAADEAVRRDAGLTIVGCFALPLLTDYGLAPTPSAAEVDQVRAATQQRLDDAARRVAATRPGLAVNGCAVGGRARRELVEQAEQADLLVVGSSGTGDSPAYLVGSVAHALMRNSPCPVVLVPGVRQLSERPGVTVAVDGTSGCDAALDWAADEADLLQGRLTVFHVWAYPYAAAAEPSEGRDITRVDAALAPRAGGRQGSSPHRRGCRGHLGRRRWPGRGRRQRLQRRPRGARHSSPPHVRTRASRFGRRRRHREGHLSDRHRQPTGD